MRALAAAVITASVSLLAGGADARQTYCQKAARGEKVVAKQNGVTVYRSGRVYSACSDSKRRALTLYVVDPGVKAKLVRAANGRCLSILFTGKNRLPEILFKDLGQKTSSVTVRTVGYGSPAASVGSLAVSKNCAAAWGQSISDGAGTTTRQVVAEGFGAATSLTSATTLATVAARDDTRHVGVKAAGRRVKVSWTEKGKRKSQTLP